MKKKLTIAGWKWKPLDASRWATAMKGPLNTRRQSVGSGAVFWDESKRDMEFRSLRELLEHMATYNHEVKALLEEYK